MNVYLKVEKNCVLRFLLYTISVQSELIVVIAEMSHLVLGVQLWDAKLGNTYLQSKLLGWVILVCWIWGTT